MIIQFEKPEEKSLEDKFIETLNDEQTEMFSQIWEKALEELETLNEKYLEKVAECEIWKLKAKMLEKD